MKGFAIHNAPTDHGGIIPATQMKDSQMGNAFVRAGDGHFCPQCKCWSTVQPSHNHVIFDGKPVAYVDDKLSCGAKILEQQTHVVGESTSTSQENTQSTQKHSAQFKCADKHSKEPIKNKNYVLTFENGEKIYGKTDENGLTEVINAQSDEKVSINFLFTSPKGDVVKDKDIH
jgi:uncharacterized Zn-binding protein involved in type VI secretion